MLGVLGVLGVEAAIGLPQVVQNRAFGASSASQFGHRIEGLLYGKRAGSATLAISSE
jgi:hypothetical protein